MGQLDGRTALVTGASSGMGRATARLFAREGAAVALVARREPELQALAGEITADGGTAVVCAADLTDRATVAAAVQRAVAALGRLDIVANIAGTNIPRRALTVLDPADWEMMLGANLTAAFHVTQAVLPTLRQQGDGLILYVSSYAVQRPDQSGVAYQASKHGMVGLAHGTREEERANGIRTTVIFPGLTDTPLVEKRPTPTPPEVLAKALQPEDVAAACLFVAALPARVRVPQLEMMPSQL